MTMIVEVEVESRSREVRNPLLISQRLGYDEESD